MGEKVKGRNHRKVEGPDSETMKQTSGDTFHGYLEGVRAFCEEDYATALRRFNSILIADTHNPELLAACGHVYLHQGDRDKALECYDRAENIGPNQPDVTYNRILLHAREGEWDKVHTFGTLLIGDPPSIKPGSFYLGLFFETQEELLSDVALFLGNACRQRGKNEEAKTWFQRALEYKPDSVTARQRIAEIAILSNSFLEAINHLNEVLEKSPLEEDRIHAHNNLGIACYENGMLEDAISHLSWVLRHAPGNPTAIHNLNFIYEREGIFEKEDTSHSIRFMDVKEGASPIFGLTLSGDRSEGEVTIIGRSSEMLRVMRHSRVAAASDSPVLISGENGTGKELISQVIALNSSRRDGPFIVVNCASMPELLLESELFGHEKGAFTGARARKMGALELAERGTVFLDEVTALTPMLQGRLLRALRDGRFTPLGGIRSITMNVRLIVATNRDLKEVVREGSFREDLYYELSVIPIHMPPLRDRRDDIPLLVDYFLNRYSRHSGGQMPRMNEDDLQILKDYDWPGNVRELENLIARAVVMGTKSSLYLEELARLRRHRACGARREKENQEDDISYPVDISLADLEKRHIMRVLEVNGHNQRQAARVLGINPSTLWRKLKSYEEK